ncbi:hypothetical protein OWV82_021927 [Melia azedarach]|uniref:Uncharacterized protein n=1 Tax=Melia azedarach TaxID=155640 RepID=A0ACC1X244_MELAZ|nr:hypothetical protein OWV82_021927 [Melia azedarach]
MVNFSRLYVLGFEIRRSPPFLSLWSSIYLASIVRRHSSTTTLCHLCSPFPVAPSSSSTSLFLSLPPPLPVLDTTIINCVFVDFSLYLSSFVPIANPFAPNPTSHPPKAASSLAPTATLSPSLSLTSKPCAFLLQLLNLVNKIFSG